MYLVLVDLPIFGNIGDVGVADDDQQIKIGLIAVLRIIDPVAATITAEQDDLLDLAVLLPRLRRARGRNGKFVHQNPRRARQFFLLRRGQMVDIIRSEEHTSELQSLMRISYAVFCLKKKKNTKKK